MKQVNEIRVVFETDQKILAHGNSLRGFISKHFPQNPLLSNHMGDGRTIYIFPRVQYRILDNRAVIIGVKEGVEVVSALTDHFDYLELGSKKYPILKKIVTKQKVPVGISPRMISYRFLKPWLALNKNNYSRYKLLHNIHDKKQLLRKILTANLLSLAKGIEANILENIVVDRLELRPQPTTLKRVSMLGFYGSFSVNFFIPELWGIGKSVSRGFGIVRTMPFKE